MYETAPAIPYRIDFYGPNGSIVRIATVRATDDLDACDRGWDSLPEGADDFQVTALDDGAP